MSLSNKNTTPKEGVIEEVELPAADTAAHKSSKVLEYSRPVEIVELKADGDEWEVSGYVSVFNNIDLGRDIVKPGAFKRSLKEKPKVRFLRDHDPRLVLGVPKTLKEDSKGLFGRFKISKTKLGEETHELLQDGALDSFSFGYMAQDYEIDEKENVRSLLDVDLLEASLVAMPMNPKAVVTGFKDCLTLVDKANLVTQELKQLFDDLRALVNKDRPLSTTKQQEIMELLETFSGLDAVRSDFQSILTAKPMGLVESRRLKFQLAELRKRYPESIKE